MSIKLFYEFYKGLCILWTWNFYVRLVFIHIWEHKEKHISGECCDIRKCKNLQKKHFACGSYEYNGIYWVIIFQAYLFLTAMSSEIVMSFS